MSTPNHSPASLESLHRNFEKASKASHALVDQTLQNVLTILSVTPGKKKWISDPNWIQQRNNAIWIDSMNIFIEKLIAIHPEAYWIAFSDTQSEKSIRQEMAINSSADIEITLKNILEDIRTQALSIAKQQFADQYKDMNSASLEIDAESSLSIETTLDESIEEHKEWIVSHMTTVLKNYQATQDARLKRELLSLLETQLTQGAEDLRNLTQQYEINKNAISQEIVALQKTSKAIDFTDVSAPEMLRKIANDLEGLNTKLEELISTHKRNTQENMRTQETISAEIKDLREAVGIVTHDESILVEPILTPLDFTINQDVLPPQDNQPEVTSETTINEHAQAFRTAYETVIMTLNERSSERIAYTVAFDILQSPTASTKSKRDKVNDFLSSVAESENLDMTGFDGIHIEKKGLLGRTSYTLNPTKSLDEVFASIKISKVQSWPQSVSKTDL